MLLSKFNLAHRMNAIKTFNLDVHCRWNHSSNSNAVTAELKVLSHLEILSVLFCEKKRAKVTYNTTGSMYSAVRVYHMTINRVHPTQFSMVLKVN